MPCCCVQSHQGGMLAHEIACNIKKYFQKERLTPLVDTWLPTLLSQLLEAKKLENVHAGMSRCWNEPSQCSQL